MSEIGPAIEILQFSTPLEESQETSNPSCEPANIESPISFFTKSSGELSEIYAVDHCDQTDEITVCSLTPREDDTFLRKLFISLDINTIYSISYNDTFDQEVKISFTNLSWQNLSDEKFTFDMPPKIDIVYH